MNRLIERFTCWACNRHLAHLHNADYEVCRCFWCAVAYWLENRANVFAEYYP